jgi:hypothetical protein
MVTANLIHLCYLPAIFITTSSYIIYLAMMKLSINADVITFSDSDGNTALHLVICKNKNGGSTFLHSACDA